MSTCPRCGRAYGDEVRFCPADGEPIAATLTDPYLGQVLMGQFKLTSLAGRGAMGTVYRAEQTTVHRTVAVKILRRDLLREPTVVKRFLREARAAARLSHPSIVTVHLVGEAEDGTPYIVMEYVDGVTLGALCEQEGGPLPIPRAIGIARQIAEALAEAHAHGIVHRDLKPENILIVQRAARSGRPGGDRLKVVDFGIAKILRDEQSDVSNVSRDGTIFGTPHFIAPEQASGQEVDARADLYSLGVILFRMVTGRLPFEGGSGMQILIRHMKEQPPRPRSIRPDLPEALEQLILRAMAKSREERFPDADQLIEALGLAERGLGGGETLLGVAPMRRAQPATASVVVAAASPPDTGPPEDAPAEDTPVAEADPPGDESTADEWTADSTGRIGLDELGPRRSRAVWLLGVGAVAAAGGAALLLLNPGTPFRAASPDAGARDAASPPDLEAARPLAEPKRSLPRPAMDLPRAKPAPAPRPQRGPIPKTQTGASSFRDDEELLPTTVIPPSAPPPAPPRVIGPQVPSLTPSLAPPAPPESPPQTPTPPGEPSANEPGAKDSVGEGDDPYDVLNRK